MATQGPLNAADGRRPAHTGAHRPPAAGQGIGPSAPRLLEARATTGLGPTVRPAPEDGRPS
jgi:hypothetical protein